MIEVPVYNQEGKQTETLKLSEKVFKIVANAGLIQEVVTAFLANRRTASAHTKTRGEVSGGGKKPWRQKGTGRARHGSSRSPIWRGGGVTFGPRNTRNFSKKVNAKARQKALLMTLSDKVAEKKFFIIDAAPKTEGKTKKLFGYLQKLPKSRSQLIILDAKDSGMVRASRNIPTVDVSAPASLNAYDVLTHDSLVITKKAVVRISEKFSPVKA